MSELTKAYLDESLQQQGIKEMLSSFGNIIVDMLDRRRTDLNKRLEAGFSELRREGSSSAHKVACVS